MSGQSNNCDQCSKLYLCMYGDLHFIFQRRFHRDKNVKKQLHKEIIGLCITKDYIYLSCNEELEDYSNKYFVRRQNRKTGSMMDIVGFDVVRGVACDDSDFFYAADSHKNRILKFDANWNPICKTSDLVGQSGTFFTKPFGIHVTGDYVFVCDSRGNRIRILDKKLNLICDIDNTKLFHTPTDITSFHGKYFVTATNGIVCLDIDFGEDIFEAHVINNMTTDRNDIKTSFKELRGICANDHFLYASERYGRILCLAYVREPVQLKHVAELSNCSPMVIAQHDGRIFYTRKVIRDYGQEEFTIAEIFTNGNEMTTTEHIVN